MNDTTPSDKSVIAADGRYESMFASRVGLSPSEITAINRSRQAALARHVTGAAGEARAAAEQAQRNDPSNAASVAARVELRDLRARRHERS